MQLPKPNRITLCFVLIFVVGVLSFVAYINHSLEQPSSHEGPAYENLSDTAGE